MRCSIFSYWLASLAIMASAQGEVADECWYGKADFLYWTSHQKDLDYAIGTSDSLNFPQPMDGKVYYLDPAWDPGFRVTLGYRLPCDCWNAEVVFTDFHTTAKSQVTNPTALDQIGPPFDVIPGVFSTLIAPSLLQPQVGFTGTSPHVTYAEARSHQSTDYKVLDFLLSRALDFECGIRLVPVFGIRALFLEQKQTAQYINDMTQTDTSLSVVFGNTVADLSWKSRYNAGGLHGGFEGVYDFGCGWRLLGKVAGSLVAGSSRVSQFQHVVAYDVFGPSFGPVDVTLSDTDNNDLLIVSGAEFNLGLAYDFCVCGRPVTLAASYEFNHWWNVPVQRRFTSDTAPATSVSASTGGLGFHGGVFSVATAF